MTSSTQPQDTGAVPTITAIQEQQTRRVLELTASLQEGDISLEVYEIGMEAAHEVARKQLEAFMQQRELAAVIDELKKWERFAMVERNPGDWRTTFWSRQFTERIAELERQQTEVMKGGIL